MQKHDPALDYMTPTGTKQRVPRPPRPWIVLAAANVASFVFAAMFTFLDLGHLGDALWPVGLLAMSLAGFLGAVTFFGVFDDALRFYPRFRLMLLASGCLAIAPLAYILCFRAAGR